MRRRSLWGAYVFESKKKRASEGSLSAAAESNLLLTSLPSRIERISSRSVTPEGVVLRRLGTTAVQWPGRRHS